MPVQLYFYEKKQKKDTQISNVCAPRGSAVKDTWNKRVQIIRFS